MRGIVPILLATAATTLAGAAFGRSPAAADTSISAPDSAGVSRTGVRLRARDDSAEQIRELKTLLQAETVQIEPARRTWANHKNPRIAMLCSLAFPGLGQLYNERPKKAFIAFGVEMYYLWKIFDNYKLAERTRLLRDSYDPASSEWDFQDRWYSEYKARVVDWVWWTSAAVIVLVFDAYVDAHLHDMRFEVGAEPVEGGAGLTLRIPF